jgi:hypothetical protein
MQKTNNLFADLFDKDEDSELTEYQRVTKRNTAKQLLASIPIIYEYATGGEMQSIYGNMDYNTGYVGWANIVKGLNGKLTDTNKRARIKDFDIDLDIRYLARLWIEQQGLCAITGVEMQFQAGSLTQKNPYNLSIDRVCNSQGYVKGNIQLITHWANNAKSTWDESVLKEMIKISADRLSRV